MKVAAKECKKMNDKEKCLFDLRGYIVVEDVLSPAQVALANEAIDCHAASIQNRPADLSGGHDPA